MPFGETLVSSELKSILTSQVRLEKLQRALGEPQLVKAELPRSFEGAYSAQTGRVAQIVGDHDGRVETLEIKDHDWVVVVLGLRLGYEGDSIWCVL